MTGTRLAPMEPTHCTATKTTPSGAIRECARPDHSRGPKMDRIAHWMVAADRVAFVRATWDENRI